MHPTPESHCDVLRYYLDAETVRLIAWPLFALLTFWVTFRAAGGRASLDRVGQRWQRATDAGLGFTGGAIPCYESRCAVT